MKLHHYHESGETHWRPGDRHSRGLGATSRRVRSRMALRCPDSENGVTLG